jgi:hypothetical protein
VYILPQGSSVSWIDSYEAGKRVFSAALFLMDEKQRGNKLQDLKEKSQEFFV